VILFTFMHALSGIAVNALPSLRSVFKPTRSGARY
jgi:hypothetical protein